MANSNDDGVGDADDNGWMMFMMTEIMMMRTILVMFMLVMFIKMIIMITWMLVIPDNQYFIPGSFVMV